MSRVCEAFMLLVAGCLVPLALLLLAHHHEEGRYFWWWYGTSVLAVAVWAFYVGVEVVKNAVFHLPPP